LDDGVGSFDGANLASVNDRGSEPDSADKGMYAIRFLNRGTLNLERKRMLHIVGVSHSVQARKKEVEETEAQKAFSGFLKQIIQEVHPVFIAEEQSEENLAGQEKISIPKEIADSEGIEPRFCDPNKAERKSIGYLSGEDLLLRKRLLGRNLPFQEAFLKAYSIEMAQYFPRREQFWLRGLAGCREHNAVFVCGDNHVESFTSLLKGEGIPHMVVARGIGMTADDHANARRIVEYLEAHPELINSAGVQP
jgi:hypothetical protein